MLECVAFVLGTQARVVSTQDDLLVYGKIPGEVLVLNASLEITQLLELNNVTLVGNGNVLTTRGMGTLFQTIGNASLVLSLNVNTSCVNQTCYGLAQQIADSTLEDVILNVRCHSNDCYGLAGAVSNSSWRWGKIKVSAKAPSLFFGVSAQLSGSSLTNVSMIIEQSTGGIAGISIADVIQNCSISGFATRNIRNQQAIQPLLANSVLASELRAVVIDFPGDIIGSTVKIGLVCSADIYSTFHDTYCQTPIPTSPASDGVSMPVLQNVVFNEPEAFLARVDPRGYFMLWSSDVMLKFQVGETDQTSLYGLAMFYYQKCEDGSISAGNNCAADACDIFGQGCGLLNECGFNDMNFQCVCADGTRDPATRCVSCLPGYIEDSHATCYRQVPNDHGICYEITKSTIKCMCEAAYSGLLCTVNKSIYGTAAALLLGALLLLICAGCAWVRVRAEREQSAVMTQISMQPKLVIFSQLSREVKEQFYGLLAKQNAAFTFDKATGTYSAVISRGGVKEKRAVSGAKKAVPAVARYQQTFPPPQESQQQATPGRVFEYASFKCKTPQILDREAGKFACQIPWLQNLQNPIPQEQKEPPRAQFSLQKPLEIDTPQPINRNIQMLTSSQIALPHDEERQQIGLDLQQLHTPVQENEKYHSSLLASRGNSMMEDTVETAKLRQMRLERLKQKRSERAVSAQKEGNPFQVTATESKNALTKRKVAYIDFIKSQRIQHPQVTAQPTADNYSQQPVAATIAPPEPHPPVSIVPAKPVSNLASSTLASVQKRVNFIQESPRIIPIQPVPAPEQPGIDFSAPDVFPKICQAFGLSRTSLETLHRIPKPLVVQVVLDFFAFCDDIFSQIYEREFTIQGERSPFTITDIAEALESAETFFSFFLHLNDNVFSGAQQKQPFEDALAQFIVQVHEIDDLICRAFVQLMDFNKGCNMCVFGTLFFNGSRMALQDKLAPEQIVDQVNRAFQSEGEKSSQDAKLFVMFVGQHVKNVKTEGVTFQQLAELALEFLTTRELFSYSWLQDPVAVQQRAGASLGDADSHAHLTESGQSVVHETESQNEESKTVRFAQSAEPHAMLQVEIPKPAEGLSQLKTNKLTQPGTQDLKIDGFNQHFMLDIGSFVTLEFGLQHVLPGFLSFIKEPDRRKIELQLLRIAPEIIAGNGPAGKQYKQLSERDGSIQIRHIYEFCLALLQQASTQ